MQVPTSLPPNSFLTTRSTFVLSKIVSGIQIPILPGLLPVLSLGQVQRFCKMCEAYLPAKLEESLQDSSGNHPDIGAKWALNQVSELLQENCPGFHLYALNKPESTLAILEGLSRNP